MKNKIIKLYKYLRQFLFSKEELSRITDCYAYLYQLEGEWRNTKQEKFCLDIAICRKYLMDMYPKYYDEFDYHTLMDVDMYNHVLGKRYTDNCLEIYNQKMR